ncbi:MAG: ATP phosphoribosyltransferase regulatory subunit [Pseudomonadota bacterium]
MTRRAQWLLPDGIDEALPVAAKKMERLRRALLDQFEAWGYDLVMPATLEYVESLIPEGDSDLALQTFKIIDQLTGRSMGVPADITPQVARIDAHRLANDQPQRLCYLGATLHTLPDKFAGSRNPLQIGAELYGDDGIASDAEIVALLLNTLRVAEIPAVTLELSHMAVFHGICDNAEMAGDFETEVLECLLRKDATTLASILEESDQPLAVRDQLFSLLQFNGGSEVIDRARSELQRAPKKIHAALDALERLIDLIIARVDEADIHIDLAELRGYRYHTGVMYAAYTPTIGHAIAWGGRYDGLGEKFGRNRPATGFSTDLKLLAALSAADHAVGDRVFAPADEDPSLLAKVAELRAGGVCVIQGLSGHDAGAREMGCHKALVKSGAGWQIEDV